MSKLKMMKRVRPQEKDSIALAKSAGNNIERAREFLSVLSSSIFDTYSIYLMTRHDQKKAGNDEGAFP
jgi:hypothetical protein